MSIYREPGVEINKVSSKSTVPNISNLGDAPDQPCFIFASVSHEFSQSAWSLWAWGRVLARTGQYHGSPVFTQFPFPLSHTALPPPPWPREWGCPALRTWPSPSRKSWTLGYTNSVSASHLSHRSVSYNTVTPQRKRKWQVAQTSLWPLQGRRSAMGLRHFRMINARNTFKW